MRFHHNRIRERPNIESAADEKHDQTATVRGTLVRAGCRSKPVFYVETQEGRVRLNLDPRHLRELMQKVNGQHVTLGATTVSGNLRNNGSGPELVVNSLTLGKPAFRMVRSDAVPAAKEISAIEPEKDKKPGILGNQKGNSSASGDVFVLGGVVGAVLLFTGLREAGLITWGAAFLFSLLSNTDQKERQYSQRVFENGRKESDKRLEILETYLDERSKGHNPEKPYFLRGSSE